MITDSVRLSTREKEVLEQISLGFSVKQISQNLYIAESTVNTHKQRLYRKFNCPNMANLVRKGFELGAIRFTASTTP